MDMTSNRPYLIRSLHEWIFDNDMTPHLLVDTSIEGVVVPEQYINDGKIILNITPTAIHDLEFGNQWIFFSARFNGILFRIELPVHSVLAIYAKENGRGMVFPEDIEDTDATSTETEDKVQSTEKKTATGKPNLTVVK